jgi:hypothetical protein
MLPEPFVRVITRPMFAVAYVFSRDRFRCHAILLFFRQVVSWKFLCPTRVVT